ncbi:MAG TPA: acyl-CoA dehydrogenase family protein [Jatrophihabitans sp.]|nr:acyl-CoA dehydrogenase family protein [Jatrophihabitans sp.]
MSIAMTSAASDDREQWERSIVATVREFVDREVRGRVREAEHRDEYPEQLIEQMKRLGIFGLMIAEEHGGTGVSAPCFAQVTAELARGWMSLAGAMGGHTVVTVLIQQFGTAEQKARYLPRLATGELRATMALTEPAGGSDLAAMRTVARRDDNGYVLNGTKTWITNAERAGVIAVLCKTDPRARPAHDGMSVLLVEKVDGVEVSTPFKKLGYRGVETCEVSLTDVRLGPDALLGGSEGEGFRQMMSGLEIGRIQVASRAVGVAQAAFDDALAYAQQRTSFGRPIWQHQSIGNYLADMATKLTAARQLVDYAARRYDRGERTDLEAGMAKLFASETAMELALTAMRIHGGYGYSTEFDVERYFRDAPLMIIGEGTNEIQRNVIVGQLIRRGGL